jgi:hypothetical protein
MPVLRRQITRVRCPPGDRLWLAALSRPVPHRRWGEVFMVTSATVLTWHRHLVARTWVYSSRRRPGRAVHGSHDPEARDPAGDGEPHMGHRRVQGELSRLGHPSAAFTVWQILHDAWIDPALPPHGPTWKQFLAARADGIFAVDFVHLDTVPFAGDQTPKTFIKHIQGRCAGVR